MNAPHRPTPRDNWLNSADSWHQAATNAQVLPRAISSAVLFNGTSEVIIEHAGSQYRLKITRQNKLILNK